MSIADVVDLLACPSCLDEVRLELDGRMVRCPRRHSFDIARQGYLNLLGAPPPRNADTAAMIAARDQILSGAAYAPLLGAVSQAVQRALEGRSASGPAGLSLLDCGSGTGHYLGAVLAALAAPADAARTVHPAARGIAVDVSVAAARRAARWPLRIGAVVADAWRRLPVRADTVDAVLNVFAPRRPEEFARILAPRGVVVTAHPLPSHLHELRRHGALIGMHPDKSDRLDSTFRPAGLTPIDRRVVEHRSHWEPAVVHAVLAMGPNAFHRRDTDQVRGPGERRTAEQAEPPSGSPVTIAVEITTWELRS